MFFLTTRLASSSKPSDPSLQWIPPQIAHSGAPRHPILTSVKRYFRSIRVCLAYLLFQTLTLICSQYKDYVITRYIAEFANTFSSLIFIIYGIYGLAKLHQKGHATLGRSIPYFGLMGVGVCSAGYHMTLKYHTQMSDELSMHLLITPLLYRILTIQTSPQYTRLIGVLLLTEFTVVMVVHMVLNEFLLHAVTFGAGVLLVATQSIKLVSRRVPDPLTRKKLRNIGLFGCGSFLFGYMVWLIDEWACSPLIHIRHSVGLPLAFVFELHGWWHVFTAIGGYIAVEVVDMITSGEVHKDPTDELAWPVADVARFIGGAPAAKKVD